ncbi:Polyphenol oxidase [Entomobacter blattae]|uniref:Purine nucleoside phosphorylase n=2 Tax=Entomobacter blattae TaxID=2762277 RepID=A0A7H1NQ90_9PROT|nr:Polyphenol oxidase [Entomobacter blattae]
MENGQDKGWFLTSSGLKGVTHGFFTRTGGGSQGDYASLNCSLRSEDSRENIRENMARISQAMGVKPAQLARVRQVHGNKVAWVKTFSSPTEPMEEREEADAMVTTTPGVALGVVTADCAPVLLASPAGEMVGAAHAGWRGAAGGVLENTVQAFMDQGFAPEQIQAVIGPCIARASYQVQADMKAQVEGHDVEAKSFFFSQADGSYLFDLACYCQHRLKKVNVSAMILGQDTLSQPERFFSHRRRVLLGQKALGLQMSVIVCLGKR